MIKKSLIIMSALTSLMLATTMAQAQHYGRRAYCEDYARRVSYRQVDPRDVVGGAVGGAVLGGVVGTITGNGQPGNVGTGLALGGIAGGAVGAATSQGGQDHRAFRRAFRRCMNQGQRVYDGYSRPTYSTPYYSRPTYATPYYSRPARDPRAVEYCMSRYRSYDPNTGTYVSYSGEYLPCP